MRLATQARTVRVVSRSALPPVAEPAEIDRLVSTSLGGDGQPIYRLDTDAISDLRPDLVLAQDLCAVCAVPPARSTTPWTFWGCQAEVISPDPSSLDEALEGMLQVGTAAGAQQRAHEVLAGGCASGSPGSTPPWRRWSDPGGSPWSGAIRRSVAATGSPAMLQVAGAEAVLACPGWPSVRMTWAQIPAAAPQLVVFRPCGSALQAAAEETGRSLLGRRELAGVEALVAVDASAFCSRPGPRLVDGVEILAAALHPGRLPATSGHRRAPRAKTAPVTP